MIDFSGGRSIVKHTARILLSPVIDRRTDFDHIRERLFERSRSEIIGCANCKSTRQGRDRSLGTCIFSHARVLPLT
jgi:hypothetical protein